MAILQTQGGRELTGSGNSGSYSSATLEFSPGLFSQLNVECLIDLVQAEMVYLLSGFQARKVHEIQISAPGDPSLL